MTNFYLLGSVISVVCFLIGEHFNDDRQEFIPNQKVMMMLLAAFLSWFGIIGTIVFGLYERENNDTSS